ncbi:unnamed protein product [Cyclocybe aegerita]|uniref:Pheromone-regulated membrane protein 10 n=1 Tax=Cyclocybe aegerita TaxID=1973307 RepID=A0A8S0VZZ2_CYCAE|nr:unnamed protein product [Cyclocybe aegerita]
MGSASDNDRPPGGTSRSGARTPRKVQWMDVHELEQRSSHMLDESGLDPDAFLELTDALERHQRTTPLKQVHYYSPQSSEPSSTHSPEPEVVRHHTRGDSFYLSSAGSSRTFASYSSSPDCTRSPSPTHYVPGNYIGDSEDAGLPGTRDLRQFAKKKARTVVRGHIGIVSAHGASRSEKGSRKLRRGGHRPDMDPESAPASSPERGAGILTTILSLYGRPNAASSYTDSEGFDTDVESTNRGWTSDEVYPEGTLGSDNAEGKDPGEKKRNKFRIPRATMKVPSMFGHVSRPTTARSAGGVIGPLIASTGNLAGFAAPTQSQLQPNVKEPGYRLSRYTVETKPISRPAAAFRRVNSSLSELRRSPSSDPGTATPASGFSSPFYRGASKSNLSLLGSYASSIRNVGRKTGSSSPVSEGYASQHASPNNGVRRKRKKEAIYITRHVAHIIRREEFIMKLTRAMMMFGGPSHRLQSQIQSAAKVLDIELSFLYLPDVVVLSFDDSGTGTSHIKLIRQSSGLDLGKLNDAFSLYWKVIHDKLSVSDASVELDNLMRKKPLYNWWQLVVIGGFCSASICTVSFGGSFADASMSFPLGGLLVAIQMLSVRNVLYSYVFEVSATTLFSFIAAALAASHRICYSAIASSSVVLILPGFLVLIGALELMSRNIISGSVRLCFAIVYALFLGFGFTIGAELYELLTSHEVYGAEDYACSLSHRPDGPWYQRTPSQYWAFLTVPMFSMFLSMRNQAPWNKREMPLLIAIASTGWVTNYFTGKKFSGQSDIIAAVGAFAVGLVANIYARIFSGNAFVVMITGILFQLPSGLGNGGLLSYASEQASGSSESYLSGFRTALKLVSVAIGLTIGLGLSLALTHPVQSRKREAGIFSL